MFDGWWVALVCPSYLRVVCECEGMGPSRRRGHHPLPLEVTHHTRAALVALPTGLRRGGGGGGGKRGAAAPTPLLRPLQAAQPQLHTTQARSHMIGRHEEFFCCGPWGKRWAVKGGATEPHDTLPRSQSSHLSAAVVAPRIQLPALTHTQHVLTPARHLPCSQTMHTSDLNTLYQEAKLADGRALMSGARRTGRDGKDETSTQEASPPPLLPMPQYIFLSLQAMRLSSIGCASCRTDLREPDVSQ